MKLSAQNTSRKAQTVSTPAPIGGWNTRDPLPEMKPLDAVILDNMFCLPSELQIRKGYTVWSSGISGTVKTIFDYDSPSGTEKIFAASDNLGNCSIYDVSVKGAVGAAIFTGLGSAKFSHTSFTNSGGSFMYALNGVDVPLLYDGTTWYPITGVSAPYAITGVTTTNLIDICLFKHRLWFTQKGTMACWYLPIDAIAGAATKFDFGPIFKRGGHVCKMDTWTIDGGYGVDDYFVVFTSNGEVAIYRGTDPASANTWALTGVFYIGSPTVQIGDPVAKTCKYGGDLLIICKDGIAQMSKSLMSSRVSTHLQMTDKIQPTLANDTTTYMGNIGWDLLLYPPQNMLLVNIPISSTQSYQYVMNTISGAWSRWTGLPATCWYFANENLYAGGVGGVYKAWDTQADNGADITATILPAYQKFGNSSMLKKWNMARVMLGISSTTNYGFTLQTDFNKDIQAFNMPASTPSNIGIWGVSKWGDGSVWGGTIYTERKWSSVYGMGYWGSLQVQIRTNQSDTRMYSIDYNLEQSIGLF
jgi:hypothetical protein